MFYALPDQIATALPEGGIGDVESHGCDQFGRRSRTTEAKQPEIALDKGPALALVLSIEGEDEKLAKA